VKAAVRRFPRGVTSSGSSPAIDQPFGTTPLGKSGMEEKRPRGQRVLDVLSGARAEGRVLAASKILKAQPKAPNTVSSKNEI
jgi:hypothetical protein